MGADPQQLAKLDPNKIYVENVRSALRVSTRQAQLYCDTAVRQGLFESYIEVLCPDGATAVSARTEGEIPPMVRCWAEYEGHLSETTISTSALEKRTFYRLRA